MTKFQAGKGGQFEVLFDAEWQQIFEPMEPFTETSNKSVFKDSLGNKVTMYGSGLDASNENHIKGKVDHVVIEDSEGRTIFDITQLSVAYADVYGPVQAEWDYGIESLMQVLAHGNDTYLGTNGSEVLIIGLDLGNDTVKALGGDDFIRASPGNNDMDGGSGFDTLAYHTYWWGDAPQKRGVDMDTAAGTVINPWKGEDTISGFENYRLSMQSDTIKGSGKAELFALLDGRDLLDGRGGFDTVDYSRDADYDGPGGVTVDLGKGKATDGFGKIDTPISIEGIIGSNVGDTLTGNNGRNEIAGLGGNDRLEGKGGSDTFIFKPGFDKDKIVDFQANGNNHDVMQLADFDEINKYADLKSHIKDIGDDVVIDLGGGDQITILGIDAKDLGKDHFEFQ